MHSRNVGKPGDGRKGGRARRPTSSCYYATHLSFSWRQSCGQITSWRRGGGGCRRWRWPPIGRGEDRKPASAKVGIVFPPTRPQIIEGYVFISGGLELPHLDLISRTDSRKTTTDSSKSGRSVFFRVISRNDGEDFMTLLAHAIRTGDSDLIQGIYRYPAKKMYWAGIDYLPPTGCVNLR